MFSEDVIQSPLPGMGWHSDSAASLKKELESYLSSAKGEEEDSVIAVLLPHAGYRWCGDTAAKAMAGLRGASYNRVILLGPSHRSRLPDRSALPEADAMETPLGKVPLDREAIRKLAESKSFELGNAAFTSEHSVWIELPWLQVCLKEGFQLVPLVVGQLSPAAARESAEAIRPLLDGKTLVLVSSDFMHYGQSFGYLPFQENIPEQIREYDMRAWKAFQQKDADAFEREIEQTGNTICGKNGISILLRLLNDSAVPKQCDYSRSGDRNGDYSHSVSYLSALITGVWKMNEKQEGLSSKQKTMLLRLARASLEAKVKGESAPQTGDFPGYHDEECRETRGAFVTLTKRGQLRGCIGEIMPTRPLAESVVANAISAGLNDPRFPAVTEEELKDLHYEISALTPMKKVDSPEQIEISKHGVLLKKDGRRAVFLPQVAPAQGWNVEQTLEALCTKAGLPAGAWKQGASFEVFEAEVFEEEQH